MLRPSRPMIRPLRSSLGRSTTETVVSIACSAPQRWIASVMYCLARSTAVSRASASSRFSRLAESWRASPSICLISSSLASSAVRPATRSSSCLCWATSCSHLAAAAAVLCSRSLSALSRRASSLLEPFDRRLPLGGDRLRGATASAPAPRPAGGRRAPAAPPPPGCRAPFPWPRESLPSWSFRRRARHPWPAAAPVPAARPIGVGGDAFAVGDPDGEHGAGDDRCDQGGNDDLREIRQHA